MPKPSLDEIFARPSLDEIFAPPKQPTFVDKAKDVLATAGQNLVAPAQMIGQGFGALGAAAGELSVSKDIDQALAAGSDYLNRKNSGEDSGLLATYKPKTEEGKVVEDVMTYPFKKWSELGEYMVEGSDNPNLDALKRTAWEAAPFLLGGRKLKTDRYGVADKPVIPEEIQSARSVEGAVPVGEGELITPERPSRYREEPVLNDQPQPQLLLPEPERITNRRADVEAAVVNDEANFIQQLDEAKTFNHENLSGPTVVTARDSLQVAPEVKPVVKGTYEEVRQLIKEGAVNPKDHQVFYPEGKSAESPAYVIRKAGVPTDVPIEAVKQELRMGGRAESKWLGYPDRSLVPSGERVTAAVTKSNEVLTNPVDIMEASTNKEVKWAAEGAPEEVVNKAIEVSEGDNANEVGKSIPSQEKTSPELNMGLSETLPASERGVVDSNIIDMNLGVNPLKAMDKLVEGTSKLWQGKTTFDVKNFGRGFGEIQFLAEKVPGIAKLYESFQHRKQNRKAIEVDLYRGIPEEGIRGMESLGQLRKIMSKKEVADLDSLIEYSDAYGIYFTPDVLKTTDHPFSKRFSDKTIEAYNRYKEVNNFITTKEFALRRELVTKPYRNKPWFNELQQIVDGTIAKEDVPNYLDDTGLAYNPEFIKTLDKIEKRIAELNESEKQYLEKPYHASRTREQGDWEVRVYPVINGVKSPQEVFMQMAKTPDQAATLQRALETNPQEFFKYNYDRLQKSNNIEGWGKASDVKFKVEVEETKQPPESIYLFSGTKAAKSSILSSVLEKARDEGKIDETIYDTLLDDLDVTLDETIWARGYNRTKIKRKDYLIEGYKNKDYIEQLQDRISNMAGSITKADFAMDALEIMKDASTVDKVFLDDLIRNALENKNSRLNKWGVTARTAVSIIHLGLKPVSLVVNGFTNAMMGAGEMNMRLRNAGFKAKADLAVPKAQADLAFESARYGLDAARNRFNKGQSTIDKYSKRLTEEEQKFLAQTERLGIDEPQMIREQAGLTGKGVNDKIQAVSNYVMAMFQWGEKVFNRQSLSLAMFRELRANKVPYEQAAKEAWSLSDTVHGDMSPENMPLHLQKGGEPVRTALTLRRWQIHYWNWVFNRMSQKQYRPIARAAFVTTILGGVTGLPLFNAINDVIERKYGNSPKLALKKYLMNKADVGEEAANTVLYGVPSTTIGVNFSRQMSVDVPFFFEEGDKTFGERVAGVYASEGKALGQSLDYFKSNNMRKGIETFPLTPDVVALPLSAYRQKTEGVTNKKGEVTKDRNNEPVQFTTSEAVKKSLGFSPSRIAEMQQMQQSEYNLETYYKKQKQIVESMPKKTPEDRDAYQKAKQELNDEIREQGGLVSTIKSGAHRPDYRARRRRRFERSLTEGED